jgi:hypothetical protein
MPELLPKSASSAGSAPYENARESAIQAAAHAVDQLANYPALQAALWLYVDDLERSHAISQNIEGPVGAYWHGIMHRREGDFWNSKYWFRQAGKIIAVEGYEPGRFVDQVEEAAGANPGDLVDVQRQEWKALFDYCAEKGL